MKKILFLALISFLAFNNSYSQERNDILDSVQVQSSEGLIEFDYNIYYDGVKNYDGVVGFIFTVANYNDTIDKVYLEGGYDGTTYVVIDSLIKPLDGNHSLSDATPEYYKHRLRIPAVSGDTATFKNITYFQKNSK